MSTSWTRSRLVRLALPTVTAFAGGRQALDDEYNTETEGEPDQRPPSDRQVIKSAVRGIAEQAHQVIPGMLEAITMRRIAVGPHQPTPARRENVGNLDDVTFDSTGQGHDLSDPTTTVRLGGQMNDDVDRRRHSRNHKGVSNILAGKQRKRAQLRHRLPGSVGMDRAHAREPQ